MILGILAAIALPRLLGTSQQATDNAAKQSLGVIRTAIDHFSAAHNGVLPGADGQEATFKADLADYLRGNDFPLCQVGSAKNGNVRMAGGNGPVSASVNASGGQGWVYEYETGDFGINSTDLSNDKKTPYDEF
jgi:type II secretory pathway pseudopilin PulG